MFCSRRVSSIALATVLLAGCSADVSSSDADADANSNARLTELTVRPNARFSLPRRAGRIFTPIAVKDG